MKLRDLDMHASVKGYGGATRFIDLVRNRLHRRLKDDKTYRYRAWECVFQCEYDWLEDKLKLAVAYKGQLLMVLDDPHDDEQFDALVMALKLVD